MSSPLAIAALLPRALNGALAALPIWLQATPAAPIQVTPSNTPVVSPHAAGRVLRLDEAVATAEKNQPAILQAHAQRVAAEGRTEQARAPMLPQLNAVASYQRLRSAVIGGRAATGIGGTGQGGAGGGVGGAGGAPSAFATNTGASGVNIFTFGASATQLLWDFGTSYRRYQAADRMASSFEANERTTGQLVVTNVRKAFFAARAQKALVAVAKDNVENLDRHLAQARGFASAGTQPEIAVAQSLTDFANGRTQLITAENAYELAKATLVQAMGGGQDASTFDVADEELPAIEGEEATVEALLPRALSNRPELVSLERQKQSQEFTRKSVKGAYWPVLSASAGASETGVDLADLGPAWNVGVALNWPFFQGGLTRGQVKEAAANVDATSAQIDAQKLQIRVDVQQALLSIRAAKETQASTSEAISNARTQLRLAEGRFAAGVGNIIELGDAQLALTNANALFIQAQFQLASARADLLTALGQR